MSEYDNEYYQKNKEARKLSCKKYNDANKEKRKLANYKWRKENKEYYSAYQKIKSKKYREENKEAYKEYYKVWKRKNKGRFNSAAASAKKRNMEFNLTLLEYESIISKGYCHYCKNKLHETGSGLDRKNNEPFYNIYNSVPCCKRCNLVFNRLFSYEEKLILAEILKQIDEKRINEQKNNKSNNVGEPIRTNII